MTNRATPSAIEDRSAYVPLTKDEIEGWRQRIQYSWRNGAPEAPDEINRLCAMAENAILYAEKLAEAEQCKRDLANAYVVEREHLLRATRPTIEEQVAGRPRGAYKPLSVHEIDLIRGCLDDGTYTKQEQKDIGRLCDMAINCLLYVEEIQRLRDKRSTQRERAWNSPHVIPGDEREVLLLMTNRGIDRDRIDIGHHEPWRDWWRPRGSNGNFKDYVEGWQELPAIPSATGTDGAAAPESAADRRGSR